MDENIMYGINHRIVFTTECDEEQILKYFINLEKLEGLSIFRFHYVKWTDELEVHAKYFDFEFIVEMDWGGDLVLRNPVETPKELFDKVHDQLIKNTSVTNKEITEANERYIKIAKNS